MTWRPEPTDLSDDVYTAVVDHPDGAAHYGVLTALRNVAARGKPRGNLVMDTGEPHTAESLSRKMRMPRDLISTVIDRLVTIGELESVNKKSRIKSRLSPQEGAAKPQAEEKRLDQKTSSSEKKRSERKDQIRPRGGTGVSREIRIHAQHPEVSHSPILIDDDDSRTYASPTDELKALFVERAGHPITQRLLDSVRANLGGDITAAFIEELRGHNGTFTNFPGFLRKLSREKARPASAPRTTAEAYKCIKCGSAQRGEGLRFSECGKVTFCECASAEYISAKAGEVEAMNVTRISGPSVANGVEQ